jgi:hypothetical protein
MALFFYITQWKRNWWCACLILSCIVVVISHARESARVRKRERERERERESERERGREEDKESIITFLHEWGGG